MKSFGLSYEDARDKNHWRLRIKGTTGQPRYTGKMAVEMLCVWGLFCNIIKLEDWQRMTIGVQSSWVHDCIIWYTPGCVVNTQMQREKEKPDDISQHCPCKVLSLLTSLYGSYTACMLRKLCMPCLCRTLSLTSFMSWFLNIWIFMLTQSAFQNLLYRFLWRYWYQSLVIGIAVVFADSVVELIRCVMLS